MKIQQKGLIFMNNQAVKRNRELSLKLRVLAVIGTVAGAVALPQIFHVIGAVCGLGSALGETFLPMHIPVMLAGFLAGSSVGAAAGLISPLVSFALTGMPSSAMVVFMMIELCAYGFFSGLLKNAKLPSVAKVLSVQIIGRAIRAAAIVFAVYVLNKTQIGVAVIWKSIITGIPGILLQLVLIPLAVFRAENKNER